MTVACSSTQTGLSIWLTATSCRMCGSGSRVMPMTPRQLVLLLVIAVLGHVMALVWYLAGKYKWSIAARTIYDLPISKEQIRREFLNSLHAPIHAVMIAPLLYFGFFANTTWLSFVLSGIGATVWAE